MDEEKIGGNRNVTLQKDTKILSRERDTGKVASHQPHELVSMDGNNWGGALA